MHHHDTQTTSPALATTATSYDYFLAMCRAIGELVDVDPGEAARQVATVYVPHWYEAGGPWQLQRTDGHHEWRVTRADHDIAGGAKPAVLALAFRDDVAGVAARMVAFDREHPFVVAQTSWCLSQEVGVHV